MGEREVMDKLMIELVSERLRKMDSSIQQPGWDVIAASEAFDKAPLVDSHNEAMKHHLTMLRGNPFQCQRSVVESSGGPSVPLAGLRPIRMEEMKIGWHHTGRVLYGTTCVDAFKKTAIITLLEDDRGKAVRLVVYNAALSSSSPEMVQRLFPRGKALAVKEPYFKRCTDGSLAVRVDSPANVESMPCSTPSHAAKEDINVDLLRVEGNKRFASQDLQGAIELYSTCIELGTNILKKSKGNSDVKQEMNKALLTVYSNRSETWLRLHKFERALADANFALSFHPADSHAKAFHRKARALCSLQQHRQACECLEMALKQFPDQKDIRNLIEGCKIHVRQSEHGEYDYAGLILRSTHSFTPSFNYSDYVGPVAIRMTDNNTHSRGLFISEDVNKGRLLLVSNAVADVQEDLNNVFVHMDYDSMMINSGKQEDLVTILLDRAMASPKLLQQLNTLKGSSSVASLTVPSLELFKPNSPSPLASSDDLRDNAAQIDISDIRDIVKFNAFGSTGNGMAGTDTSEALKVFQGSSGLWLLPSFINHSCIPNASMIFVGSVMFVHAARDLQAGKEVTLPYFETLWPYKQRKELCSKWGFSCICRRCKFERSIAKLLGPIMKEFPDLHEKAHKALSSWQQLTFTLPPECTEYHRLTIKLENKLKSLRSLSQTQKQWVQASFADAYIAGFHPFVSPSSDWSASELQKLESLLVSMHNTVPGHMMTLIVAARLFCSEEQALEGRSSNLAEKAMEVCISTFGRHSPDVLKELLRSRIQ